MLSTELEVYIKKIIIISEGNLNAVATTNGNVFLKEVIKHLRIDQVPPIKSALIEHDTRNQQAHNSLKLPYDKYYTELKNIILAYLVATEKRYKVLHEKVFPEENFTEFLQSVIETYNEFKAAFVDLEVKEYIDVLGKQVISNQDKTTQVLPKPITQIRKEATKNQMMILGQAGMGKTTSMLYMHSLPE
ncbi:MAG: hypothetical protein EAZ95_02760 [Bacteroidetes bacterium]|nr:MAG: hypothetical protein EAZ95_02760 [Bacteroidota bacterium]